MVSVLICDAALKEINKKLLEFKYIALDSSDTPYATTQSAPITELTTNGAARAMATVSHDSETGVVTMTKQFVFTGEAVVKAICPMNNATAGQGIGLYRYLPASGLLPSAFQAGGSLLVTIENTTTRPST
jgi:hypothetical protein